MFDCLFGRLTLVKHRLQGLSHAFGILMLNDVATINYAGYSLRNKLLSMLENLWIGGPTTASDTNRNSGHRLDYPMKFFFWVSRICLNQIGTKFCSHASESHHSGGIEVADHAVFAFLEREWFHSQRHSITIANVFEFLNVAHTLIEHLREIINLEQIQQYAGRIEAQRYFHRLLKGFAKQFRARQNIVVKVCRVCTQHQCRFVAPRQFL